MSNTFQKRLYDSTSILFYIIIAFYLIQAVVAVFSDFSPPLFDFTATILLLLVAFALHIRFRFRNIVPVSLGAGLFFNILGLYKMIPYNKYYVGTLYGAPQLGYHYDWIAHSIGFGLFALAYCSVMYPRVIKAFKSRYMVFLMLLLSMMGFAAIHELNEYLGFTFFGIGEGFMEFGEGDASPYEGPWENTCMDLINNLIGGIVFIGLFVLSKIYFPIKKRRLR